MQERRAVSSLNHRLTGGVAVGVIVLDQLTKLWAMSALESRTVHVIGPLRLALTRNTAGAFGLGGGAVPFLAVAAVALVVLIAVRTSSGARWPVAVALGLVLGGAFGNLADRVFRSPGLLRGAVVDFIDLGFWPVFNLADSAITCGCALLLVTGLPRREP